VSIRFLSLVRILQIQRESIDVYGGDPGVRDMGLLESAIAQPQATFGGKYLHEDIATMAAAYLYHLVMNHPFVDGNKRAGAIAAFVFLDMNDMSFTAKESDYRDLVLDVAAGKRNKTDVVAFFKRHTRVARKRKRR
jgi:death-on-curing protein